MALLSQKYSICSIQINISEYFASKDYTVNVIQYPQKCALEKQELCKSVI